MDILVLCSSRLSVTQNFRSY